MVVTVGSNLLSEGSWECVSGEATVGPGIQGLTTQQLHGKEDLYLDLQSQSR